MSLLTTVALSPGPVRSWGSFIQGVPNVPDKLQKKTAYCAKINTHNRNVVLQKLNLSDIIVTLSFSLRWSRIIVSTGEHVFSAGVSR